MKYLNSMDDLKAESQYIIDLKVEGYTGLISPEGEPTIAFKVNKEIAKILSLPTDIVSLKFESMDEAKQFIANIEKSFWQEEHGEA